MVALDAAEEDGNVLVGHVRRIRNQLQQIRPGIGPAVGRERGPGSIAIGLEESFGDLWILFGHAFSAAPMELGRLNGRGLHPFNERIYDLVAVLGILGGGIGLGHVVEPVVTGQVRGPLQIVAGRAMPVDGGSEFLDLIAAEKAHLVCHQLVDQAFPRREVLLQLRPVDLANLNPTKQNLRQFATVRLQRCALAVQFRRGLRRQLSNEFLDHASALLICANSCRSETGKNACQ